MNETLKSLHDRFYTPLPLAEYEQEVETCHHQLIERLEKPERKLVLRIIDTQNHIIEERSLDSFLCGSASRGNWPTKCIVSKKTGIYHQPGRLR